jgi:5-dehydro-4-deoxyglucarate dehydratase
MSSHREFARKLTGVFGFPITPMNADLSVDYDGLAKLVDWMTQFPFCAQVTVGGTGEIYSLTAAEAIEAVRVSVDATAKRMPVVAGVGYSAPIGVEMAKGMEKAGAAALLIMPPYYTNAPVEGLFRYYETIAGAVSIPVSLYSRDWAVFTPDMVSRLADRIPNLSFWKDGQGDTRKYQRIMAAVGDRLAWIGGIGDDCASSYFGIGVQAYTSSISNIAPKLSLAIADAGMRREVDKLNALLKKYVHPLYALRDKTRGYEVTVMKKMMEMMGKPGGPARPPLVEVKAEEIGEIERLIELYKPWSS